MAYNVELRVNNSGFGTDIAVKDKTVYLKAHWDNMDGKPSTYTPLAHQHSADDVNSGVLADARIPALAISKITSLQTSLDGKIPFNEVIMNTNPFGGKKLYINSIDNALYAADKKWVVVATRHLKSYNGETYPKLNPDWVAEYSLSGSGTYYTITNSPKPSSVVVYDGTTLKYETTHYTYNSTTGELTLTFTPSALHVYPGAEILQYLDSPVSATLSTSSFFDGSYETTQSTSSVDYYIKVRITPRGNLYDTFNNEIGYSYGSFYLSFYYAGTPEKASDYRVYNYSYQPHGIGWKKYTTSDFIGTTSSSSYVQKIYDGGNHGRSIIEFIIYGKTPHVSSYQTSPSQIEWQLDRPNLSKTGATVTKYGENKIYSKLLFGNQTDTKVEIDPTGAIKINNKNVYYQDNPPSLYSVYRGYLSNFDTTFTPGIYYFDSSTSNKPNGTTWGWVEILVNDNIDYNNSTNWLLQRIHQTDGKQYYRYKINANAWSSWYQVYSSQYKPSASDVGALPSGGGTLGGDVTLDDATSTSPEFKLKNQNFIAGIDLYNNSQILRFIDRTNSLSRIEFNLSATPGINIGGNAVYHGGNKPSLSDLNISSLVGTSEQFSTGDILGRKSLGNGALEKMTLAEWNGMISLPNDHVTNVRLANMAENTLKGRVTTGTGDPEDLSVSQVKTMLALNNVDNVADASKYVLGLKETKSNVNLKIWNGTLTEYNAIGTKDSATIYFIE